PTIGVDRMPRRLQVADLEMYVGPGRVSGATAERDQLAARNVLARVDEKPVVVEVGSAIRSVVDDNSPAAVVAPLAVDHGPVVGGHHRRIRGYGVIRTAVAVVRIPGRAVEANHDPVPLPVRIVVIHPRGD